MGATVSKQDECDLREKHTTQGQYEGVVDKRKSTDVIFLLAIIAMWLAMTAIGGRAIHSGDPYRLISPINDEGKLCGQSPGVIDKPYFYTVLTNGVGICVDNCPNMTSSFNVSLTTSDDYYCLDTLQNTIGNSPSAIMTYINQYCTDSNDNYDIQSNCGCMLKMATINKFKRCRFVDTTIASNFRSQKVINFILNFIQDMFEVRTVIFGIGIGVALLLSFIYMTFLRSKILSSIFIWGTMIAVLAMFIVLCYYSYTTAREWEQQIPQIHSNNEILGLRASSIVFVILAGLWFILMILERNNVQIAITLMTMTAECIEDMPLVLFTPIIETTAIIIFLFPWFVYVVYIASNGTFETIEYTVSGLPTPLNYQKYNLDDGFQEQLWFLFFCFLWTTEFITAVGTIIISIAVSHWYFSNENDRTIIGGCSALCIGWYDGLRYHMGTAALGSLIIATITFIRAIVLYIERQIKQFANNCLIKFVFCCINCCLYCVEKCMKFIANHAYIQTAIHGSGFCTAAKDAFFLILRNCLRIGILTTLSNLAMFIAKIMITAICGGTTYFVLTAYYQDEVNGLIAPTVLTMFLAFAVVSTFTSVFRAVVDTMLQAYITDAEDNGGTPKYVTGKFKVFIDTNTLTQEEYDKKQGNTGNTKESIDDENPMRNTMGMKV